MVPAPCDSTAPVPPPAYQRALAKHSASLHLDARTIVETLHLLALCRLAVRLARPGSPAALPKGPGGAPRVYSDASLLLIALLRTLWRLSLRDMRDWLVAWPALAAACGLPADDRGRPRVPSPGTMSKRAAQAGLYPWAYNVPIACARVLVLPGDIMIADDDGAVVVPCKIAPLVLARTLEHEDWERFSRMRLAAGGDLQRYYPLDDEGRREYDRWRLSQPS